MPKNNDGYSRLGVASSGKSPTYARWSSTTMSSVASTSTEINRPPAKRVRYLTDDSSYTTSSTAALIQREAEERATQELEEQRRASRQRVLSVWESLAARYSRELDNDDIVDLESLTVIQDSGTLKAIREVPFGSLAAQDDSDSENDEDEDELGTWDDERHSAQTAWIRLQLSRQGPPLTEEDQKDLQEFLRAEQERKQTGEPLDDIYEFSDEEQPNRGASKIRMPPNEDTGDEEEEDVSERGDVNARRDEEEEDDSASSFRPTPSEGRASSPGSANEGENLEPEEVELIENAPGPEDLVHRPAPQPNRRPTPESDDAHPSSDDEIGDPAPHPFTLQITRHSGNPQLSTPPTSKSSALSTSSDVFSSALKSVSPERSTSPRKVRFTKPSKRGRKPNVNLREKYASIIASLK
ncbi:12645_t:CDS:2, partial [Acaulospora colombiana]